MSIIIPAYNTAQYIHRAIESSLRQTHKNVEVLIIDDGSTDDTLKTADGYAVDGRVRVFTQENAGVSSARNRGIREARGEYLYFLDSDDWLEDDAITTLLEIQFKYPDKLIACGVYQVNELNGKFFRTLLNSPAIPSGLMSKEEFTEHFCGLGSIRNVHSNCAQLYRAEWKIIFREDIYYSEDGVYTFEYLNKMTGAYYLNKPILNVFISRESLTRSTFYHPVMLDSQVEAYNVLENYPGNTTNIRKLMNVSRCLFLLIPLNWSLKRGAPTSEVRRVRKAIKPYVGLFLRCKKVSLKKKLSLLYKTYTPIVLARFIAYVRKKLKGNKENITRHGEEIPRW